MKKGQTRTLQAVFTFAAGLMILIGLVILFNNFVIPHMSDVSLEKNSQVFLELINSQISKQYGILLEKGNETTLSQMISIPKKINRKRYTIKASKSNFSEYFSKGGRTYWSKRRKVEIIERSGNGSTKTVRINLSEYDISPEEARLTRKGNKEIEWHNSSEKIFFNISLEPNEINRELYLYYGNKNATMPSYAQEFNGEVDLNATLLEEEVKSQVCISYLGKKESYCKTLSAPIEGEGSANSLENLILKGTKEGDEISYSLNNP